MADSTKYKPLTRAQSKLIDTSVLIFGEAATAKDAAFIARELVQASLPHKNPGDAPVWVRKNGHMSLVIQQGYNSDGKPYGHPYGTIPRLLLFWMTTEASRTKSRRLKLGNSLSRFMVELGLNPDNGGTGAKRSDAKRLRNQMERLFRCRIGFEALVERDGRKGEAGRDMLVTEDRMLWWDKRNPQQVTLWGSWIELGQKFYEAITAAPVPVDIRAIKALKRSPLALDLYSWLTYEAFRAHKSGVPRYETWAQLHAHIGGEYTHLNNFRKKATAALAKIRIVYPGLKLGKRQGGIEILPESYPALLPRHVTIDGTCKSL
jgi:hypothetical protein